MITTTVTITIPVTVHKGGGKQEANLSVEVEVEAGWNELSRAKEEQEAVAKLSHVLKKLCEV